MSTIETYARWELSGRIKGVKLSALSVTEKHKERVLATWKRLRATDIQVVEREAPELPTWQVEIRTRNYDLLRLEIVASSEKRVEEIMSEKKEFKQWQLMTMKITKVEENDREAAS